MNLCYYSLVIWAWNGGKSGGARRPIVGAYCWVKSFMVSLGSEHSTDWRQIGEAVIIARRSLSLPIHS